jgi:predicted amidohydrolase
MPGPAMRLALLQFAPVPGDLRANLARVLDGLRQASAKGAHMLITPEMCLTGWSLPDAEIRADLALRTKADAVPALAAAAARDGITVVTGGPLPAVAGAAGAANCAITLTPAGETAVHRKMHLFGPERDWWQPGGQVQTVPDRGTVIGPLICYDGEFCEVPRLLRLAGANVMAIAATNMSPYEHDQDVIFSTRAIENECVVAVCNRTGSERGWTYFGRSLVADARGKLIAQAGNDEELLLADVTPNAWAADPKLGYIAQRRPEIYRELCASGAA